jgi:hypothetical protein
MSNKFYKLLFFAIFPLMVNAAAIEEIYQFVPKVVKFENAHMVRYTKFIDPKTRIEASQKINGSYEAIEITKRFGESSDYESGWNWDLTTQLENPQDVFRMLQEEYEQQKIAAPAA